MHSTIATQYDDDDERAAATRLTLAPVTRMRPAVDETVASDGPRHGELTLVPTTATALDGDPALLCANLALCVIEILAGARSLDHIARWVTDGVFVQLLRRSVIASRARTATGAPSMRPRVRIGIPHTCPVGDGAVEAVVVVHQQARSRAIAMRLERHRTRWRATAITVL